MPSTTKRLLSLDFVRGLTVAFMILVNNSHGEAFEMLRHAKWNGITASDFVFPFFLFIMGVSIYLSYSRRGFSMTRANFMKICRRTIVLFAIGIAINWVDKLLYTDFVTSFEELRFWAVMQRIAVCYFLVSVFALTCNHKATLPVAVGLLVTYTVIVLAGGGYVNESGKNILFVVDERIFGYNHLYHYQSVDPEGLVSTMSALANVLFGFYCGMLMRRSREMSDKIIALFTVGAVLTFAGFLLHFGLPLNKRIWSPSFACVTSGACVLLMALMMKWIDADGRRGPWVSFFEVFGINALILYVSSEFMVIIFGKLGINDALFELLADSIPYGSLASLTYAIIYMLMNWVIGYQLWRRRIIIKL